MIFEPSEEDPVIIQVKRLKRIEALARKISPNTRATDKYYDPAWQGLDALLGVEPAWPDAAG